MNAGTLFVLAIVCLASSVYSQQRGIQIRLSQKGLDYTMQEALKILRRDLGTKRFKDFSGSSGSTKFSVSNLLLRNLNIGSGRLSTSYRNGLTASVSGIAASVYGRLRYEKKAWFIKIRDTVNINARATSVSLSISLNIGKRSDGRPSLTVNSCRSHVGGLRMRFSGSRVSWLYNLFSSMIERKLKGQLADLMCKTAKDSLNRRGGSELATFPVRKAIDKWAIADYSLSAAPAFTNRYMDVFLKGEFVSRRNPYSHSSLAVPRFSTSSENNKMIYFWITDYTLNTAAEVYHKSQAFVVDADRGSRVSPIVKHLLNTRSFKFIIPELARRFPNRPMTVRIASYKPPKIMIEEGKIYMLIYAAATFRVKLAGRRSVDVFTLNIDMKADGSVSMTSKNIIGNIKDFSLTMRTTNSKVGPVNIPVNQPFIKNIMRGAVMHAANRMLIKGFPLPNLEDVMLRNAEIKLMKGVIRISTDCTYIPR